MHQPLHIGSVYLDGNGSLVDPDITHTVDPATETAGGNLILDAGKNLHGEWDNNPAGLGEDPTPKLLEMASAVAPDRGRVENWSVAWASDTLLAAQEAFSGAKFAKGADARWTVTFVDHAAYQRAQDALKLRQMAKAGARLAEIMNTIWP